MLTIEFAQSGINFLFYTTVFAASLVTLYDFVNGLDQLTVVDEWMSALEQRTFQPVLGQVPQPSGSISTSRQHQKTMAPMISPVLITPAPCTSLAISHCVKTSTYQRKHNQVQAIANPVLVTPAPKEHSGDRQDLALDSLTREQLAKIAQSYGLPHYRPGNRRKTKLELLKDLKPLLQI